MVKQSRLKAYPYTISLSDAHFISNTPLLEKEGELKYASIGINQIL